MVTIIFMLLPLTDIVILSKNINILKQALKTNPLTLSCSLLCLFAVFSYGIINPTKTLNELKAHSSKPFETTEDKLVRTVTVTNASGNYILGVFSLFLLLVVLRISDFMTLSAKLTEFSNLMANYKLLDIKCFEQEKKEEETFIIEDFGDEDEKIHWPSIIDFNKKEYIRIKRFFYNQRHRQQKKCIQVN